MCGLAGYHTSQSDAAEREALSRAVAALRHRGPDGDGFFFDAGVGLGHARLSIIDLATGDQPLYNEDGSLALVVNGEFYNYRELAPDLEAKGHRFRTRSDSEVFLHRYEEYGLPEALAGLNGMWALALWDGPRERLVLSRDRLGKKPLYYALAGQRLVFASEIKALKVFPGVDLSLDERALALYLMYGYVPAPYSIHRGIRKFPAASYGVFEAGQLTVAPYWRLSKESGPDLSEDAWLERLDATLDDAVRLRLVSDVPLGGFLSGGLDSSLIVTRMARHVPDRVTTVSIGFDDPTYDESGAAESVAARLRTDHHAHQVVMDDVDRLPELAGHFDEPFADASFLPTWHLCRAARQHVTVALSGDGGDELFAGYRRYVAGRLQPLYTALPESVRRGVVEPTLARLPAPAGYYGRSILKKAKLFLSAAERIEGDPLAVAPRLFEPEGLAALFPGLDLPALNEDPVREAAGQSASRDRVDLMQRTDLVTYLPDDILVKVDRMSMFHALEVRCPFLDHRLVELAFQMPLRFKLRGLTSKYLLKKLAVGDGLTDVAARSKQGFMVPLDVWFRGRLKGFLEAVLHSASTPWSKEAGLKLLDEHLSGREDRALQLWGLVVLGLWSRAG